MVREDKAYVSFFESNTLLICNPLTGATLGTIDLSSFADADGIAEAPQDWHMLQRLWLDDLAPDDPRRART